MNQLAKLLSEVASDLPETLLTTLVDELSLGKDSNSSPAIVAKLPSGEARTKMSRVFALAAAMDLDNSAIALAILSSFQSHEQWRDAHAIEMVWTGPSPPHTKLRRTDQALDEVIDRSRETLWIVSFAAYRMKTVLDAINDASSRSVDVSLLLESSDESEGKLSSDEIDEIRADLSGSCKFYIWPTDKRKPSKAGHRGLLHAKCAVADGQYLFVSSANLTEAAFRRNIELGVLLKSARHAVQVEEHLKWLVESKTLVQI